MTLQVLLCSFLLFFRCAVVAVGPNQERDRACTPKCCATLSSLELATKVSKWTETAVESDPPAWPTTTVAQAAAHTAAIDTVSVILAESSRLISEPVELKSFRRLGKRGLAYNDVALTNTFRSRCETCTWAYNWDSATHGLSSDLSFVPMLWNSSTEHTRHWKTNADAAISHGSKAILSFNEPDRSEQANMTPDQAASAHIEYLNQYAGRVLVGAPSVTNSDRAGQGLRWLSGFFDACALRDTGCRVDFCPVHWYSGAGDTADQWSDNLLKHLQDAHEVCGRRPIWLTEFAVPGSPEQVEEFLRLILPKLDDLEYLTAYFYFMVSIGSLMSSEASLSSFGEIYATLK